MVLPRDGGRHHASEDGDHQVHDSTRVRRAAPPEKAKGNERGGSRQGPANDPWVHGGIAVLMPCEVFAVEHESVQQPVHGVVREVAFTVAASVGQHPQVVEVIPQAKDPERDEAGYQYRHAE